MQAILLHLIHQQPRLPAPLGELSPWVDHLAEPVEAVAARLDAQRHRRVLKTHTPLDGVPRHCGVTYVVVARHPLDAAVSLYHQGTNIDRQRLEQLTGVSSASSTRPPIEQWLQRWVEAEADPVEELDSLPGVLRHLSDAWSRRRSSNLLLVHYADLLSDLEGQMRHLASMLDLDPPSASWRGLIEAVTFQSMRARAAELVPDPTGILRDPAAFFRRGYSGDAEELLDDMTLQRYQERSALLAPADLLAWLHRR